MTPSELVGAFGVVVGVLAAGAAAVAVFRANYARARIEALRADVEDRDKRIEFLEGEVTRHSEENERATAALTRIGAENARLWDRTQAVEQLTAHEAQAASRHESFTRQNGDIIILLRQVRDALKKLALPPSGPSKNVEN